MKKTPRIRPQKWVDLGRHFLRLQDQMVIGLRVKRELIGHPGTKGEATEKGWRNWLTEYLPSRYQVKNAFVVDADGRLSDQIDLVIFDRQYTPFLFNEDGVHFIPAESVYAILEVKQELNAANIRYAGQKAASVRNLSRTSAPIVHAGGKYEPRKPFEILAGIVAVSSSWKPALGQPLVDAAKKLAPNERVNIGCALQHGSFEIQYGSGAAPTLEAFPPEDRKSVV